MAKLDLKLLLHDHIVKLMEKDDLEYIQQGNIAV
jgi:hypothetical protein